MGPTTPDTPAHLPCSSALSTKRAGETRVHQHAGRFWQAARAGVPQCGTLLHIYSTATYIFSINHTSAKLFITYRLMLFRWSALQSEHSKVTIKGLMQKNSHTIDRIAQNLS
jgi:hypothetical protein